MLSNRLRHLDRVYIYARSCENNYSILSLLVIHVASKQFEKFASAYCLKSYHKFLEQHILKLNRFHSTFFLSKK